MIVLEATIRIFVANFFRINHLFLKDLFRQW